MRILFTGASSFTGFWIVKELAAAGHDVVTVLRRQRDEYSDGPRSERISQLAAICRPVYGTAFGDDRFLGLIAEGSWDLLCHHGAHVDGYRLATFDVLGAVANNTLRLAAVLDALRKANCGSVVVTGSVFENDEGAGADDRSAFSPYGLSKAFTWQLFRYHAPLQDMRLGKFVIPNPFGPFEEPRFVNYLMSTWFKGAAASVKTPLYVRDNIHVSLLAKAYRQYATALGSGTSSFKPSGYVETQGAFTQRVATEMRRLLGLRCDVELGKQVEFSEPLVRINTDRCDANALGWCETAAWQGLADYYQRTLPRPG